MPATAAERIRKQLDLKALRELVQSQPRHTGTWYADRIGRKKDVVHKYLQELKLKGLIVNPNGSGWTKLS